MTGERWGTIFLAARELDCSWGKWRELPDSGGPYATQEKGLCGYFQMPGPVEVCLIGRGCSQFNGTRKSFFVQKEGKGTKTRRQVHSLLMWRGKEEGRGVVLFQHLGAESICGSGGRKRQSTQGRIKIPVDRGGQCPRAQFGIKGERTTVIIFSRGETSEETLLQGRLPLAQLKGAHALYTLRGAKRRRGKNTLREERQSR